MIYESHIKIGLNTWDNLPENQRELLVKKSFLLGNVLPDVHPTYRVRKHRLKQFEGPIYKKVEYLASLNYQKIEKEITYKKLSKELGIVCHFLCDFFCMPHAKWGVKESMTLKHMKYERGLHKKLEEFNAINNSYDIKNNKEYKQFFSESLVEHTKEERNHTEHFENDLYYSMYMCNTVVKYILASIEKNSKMHKK